MQSEQTLEECTELVEAEDVYLYVTCKLKDVKSVDGEERKELEERTRVDGSGRGKRLYEPANAASPWESHLLRPSAARRRLTYSQDFSMQLTTQLLLLLLLLLRLRTTRAILALRSRPA